MEIEQGSREFCEVCFDTARWNPVVGDLVELQLDALDGSVRLWKWKDDQLADFYKFSYRDGQRLIQQARDIESKLEQWIWTAADGALVSNAVWQTSSRLGQAIIEDCISITIRDISGAMSEWTLWGRA